MSGPYGDEAFTADTAAEVAALRAALIHRDLWSGTECPCDERPCPLDVLR